MEIKEDSIVQVIDRYLPYYQQCGIVVLVELTPFGYIYRVKFADGNLHEYYEWDLQLI